MKIKNYFQFIIASVLATSSINAASLGASVKIDTIIINEIAVPPKIDGIGDDACWTNSNWYGINNVWINYGEKIDSTDYYGRFKVVWSKKENLLYFLVETTDDYPVGGYIAGATAAIYNYDIIEVFIDENRSGGPNDVVDPSTGKNIENAFAYHIYADFPKAGNVNNTPVVEDVPGPRIGHLPEFAIRGANDFYTREFSLKVYDSTYDDADPEFSRVQLEAGKIMGLSLAYCDNDDDDGQRDNFFGSVWVPEDKYNSHWMEADEFGPAKLVSISGPDKLSKTQSVSTFNISPNPVSDLLIVNSENIINEVLVSDISGKIITRQSFNSTKNIIIPTNELASGLYIIKLINNENVVATGKFIKK